MTLTIAHATAEVLLWARQSAGFSRREAATAIGVPAWRLELVEDGNELLTFHQVEILAEKYERPLAVFFYPAPPDEEPTDALFRRLPGAPALPWPPALQLLARRIRGRQEAAAEIYEDLDEDPPWAAVAARFAGQPVADLAAIARDVLAVSQEEQEGAENAHASLRCWVDAVESVGVLVMQSGDLSTDTMRGFASLDERVPAVLANTKDVPRARAFTLVHEFGHVALAAAGATVANEETWCNDFAGDVLMPREWLARVFAGQTGSLVQRIDAAASVLGVTSDALAVRLGRTGLVGDDLIRGARRTITSRGKRAKKKNSGGSYYLNQIAWFGPTYIQLVFAALDDAAVTYSTASQLLNGVRVDNFPRLRDTLDARTEGV